MAEYNVRKALPGDLDALNVLVNAHKNELGFVRRVTLASSIEQEEILVAEANKEIVGFVRYHHRRDTQTTLYDIVVSPVHRFLGIGKMLVASLSAEAQALGKQVIVLRCPEELPSNAFYARLGFERWNEELGKLRKLVVWRFVISDIEKVAPEGLIGN